MSDLSHRDRCTYLNFWMYREISKLYTSEDKKLTDITDVANLIDANIKINKDLIKDDFDVNYKLYFWIYEEISKLDKNEDKNSQESSGAEESLKNGKTTPPNSNKGGEGSDQNKNVAGSARNAGTEGSQNNKELKKPAKFVKYYDFSKYEPCFFNYDCTFSECREMKHLFEYFKNYDEINEKIDCKKRQKDKYYKYLTYISYLYNKHKNEKGCCSWGAEICPDYFLSCDEFYNPNKIVSAIESRNVETCNQIKNPTVPNIPEETTIINPEDENNMYIKYFTCSYINDSNFKNKGLRCYQPQFNALRRNKFAAKSGVLHVKLMSNKEKKLVKKGK
ncbi:Plasmodium vivax Vir protein, putative [Plasmodium vivax]|uniref:Vir protein, putative n=1 Tax=Plasmodium vivax TaxID=5855 RepID=A0A1G4ED56_PLAVI|nr:Plasmodium vivax Vir protein, putative [Plasmodium vivax]